MKRPSLLALLPLICLPLVAKAEAETHWALIVQEDNDLLRGTDRGYTNGTRIAFTRGLDPNGANDHRLQRFLKSITEAEHAIPLNNLRAPKGKIENIQWGFGVSQLMFTADNENARTSPDGERTYAGWLGLEFSLQVGSESSANTATLSIGVTGEESRADDAQTWWHENVSDSPVFQGWDSQAPTELTINLHLDHKTRLTPLEDFEQPLGLQLDGFYEWGGSIGNFRTDAYAGALIRFGYNLPASYTTPRVQLGSFTNTIFGERTEEDRTWSIYGFAGARAYGVLHDITLDGPLFSSWDESVDSEPLVGELSYGVAARWHWFELSLAHTTRTDEFRGQDHRSRYGSVLIRIGTDF